jgi:hypothetical protein
VRRPGEAVLLYDVLARQGGARPRLGERFENTRSACVSFPGVNRKSTYAGPVQLRYAFRLYPTPGQRIALAKAFGCARVDARQGVRFTRNARFKVLPNGKLRLPKIGDIPVRWSRPLPSEPPSMTVIRDSAGRYFASFVIDTRPDALPETEPVVGLDLGLKHFAVLSDGRKIASPAVSAPGGEEAAAGAARAIAQAGGKQEPG